VRNDPGAVRVTAVGRGVPAAPARPARSAALRALGLCAIAIAAYANSFAAGFAFDSRALILQDPRVHAATADNVDLILRHTYWWPYGESGLYRPATTLSYLFNYAVLGGGERPFGYHAFNLAVHLLNVLLVWMLVADVAERDEAALAAAAMWAVLPVSVEAVTNIVGRADLLAALGVLAGVWLYGRACDRDGRVRPLAIAGLVVATAVAVLSKESGVVLAPIVVCCELCRWRRKTSPRALGRARRRAAGRIPLRRQPDRRRDVDRRAPDGCQGRRDVPLEARMAGAPLGGLFVRGDSARGRSAAGLARVGDARRDGGRHRIRIAPQPRGRVLRAVRDRRLPAGVEPPVRLRHDFRRATAVPAVRGPRGARGPLALAPAARRLHHARLARRRRARGPDVGAQ